MALGAQVVDFVGLQFVNQLHQGDGVGQVAKMKMQIGLGVRINIEVVDALGVEVRRPPHDTVDLIAFLKKQFCKVGAVLAGDAGDERFFHWSGFAGAVCTST